MDKPLKILICPMFHYDFDEKFQNEILEIAPNAELFIEKSKEVHAEALENTEIIFGWMRFDQVEKAKKLKWLQMPSAGVNGFTNKSLYCNKDIILTNASGVFGTTVAEHVFGLILSFNKNLHHYARFQADKNWHGLSPKQNIAGSTIGIIGLGDIGTEIAKRAKAFSATVLAAKRMKSHKPKFVDELYFNENGIDTIIQKSDFLILAVPMTEATKGILSKRRIAMMKPNCFLVNVGRGGLIDQDALIEALEDDKIAGAGLDVTTPEPLPADSPLWGMPNVLITPHTSGSSLDNMELILEVFKENLKRYVNSEPLMNVVDFNAGY